MACLFCRIGEKEIPSEVVYEDVHTVAFLDIHPKAPGHVVVIPKVHAETIIDLPKGEVEPLFSAVQEVVKRLNRALGSEGYTIGINHGRRAGQEIDHLHIHIIPRWDGDAGGPIQSVVTNVSKVSPGEIAKKIREA